MHFVVEYEDCDDYILIHALNKDWIAISVNGCSVDVKREVAQDLVRYLQNGSQGSFVRKGFHGELSCTDNSISTTGAGGDTSIINLNDAGIETIICKLVDWFILG